MKERRGSQERSQEWKETNSLKKGGKGKKKKLRREKGERRVRRKERCKKKND